MKEAAKQLTGSAYMAWGGSVEMRGQDQVVGFRLSGHEIRAILDAEQEAQPGQRLALRLRENRCYGPDADPYLPLGLRAAGQAQAVGEHRPAVPQLRVHVGNRGIAHEGGGKAVDRPPC